MVLSPTSDCPEEGLNRMENEMDETRGNPAIEHAQETLMNPTPHEVWHGSGLQQRGGNIGARVATNNFQRKLYADDLNVEQTIKQMLKKQIDILVGIEPGQGTRENVTRTKNKIRSYGFAAVVTTRDGTTRGGGIIVILSPKWAKLQSRLTVFNPDNWELRGRALAMVLENKTQGMHNKLQVIAMHGINNAGSNKEDAREIMRWIGKQKREFESQNPLATTVLAGDINAALSTWMDTDKHLSGAVIRQGDRETDAFVIEEIEQMGLVDIFRNKFPITRAVTRTSNTDTNRFLDRIFATAETATHYATGIAIHKKDLIDAGSDHLMIVADIPIDTAGIAIHRVPLWEPITVTKWIRDCDELGRTDPTKVADMNELLNKGPAPKGFEETTNWIMRAAEGTVLTQVTQEYPKKVSKKPHFTTKDWKLKASLKAMRHLQLQATWGGDLRAARSKAKRRIHCFKDSPTDQDLIKPILKRCKKQDNAAVVRLLIPRIQELETMLGKEQRTERAKQINKRIKTRNNRFKDSKKLMLKAVINSIMRRQHEQEGISTVMEEGEIKYGEKEVGTAVCKFYTDWMQSRVAVTDRFGSWQDMLDLNPGALNDPSHEEFLEKACGDAKRRFSRLQEEEGAWGYIRAKVSRRDLKEAIRSMKSGTAPGPSGLTYDIIKMLDDEHLQPIVDIVNEVMTTGKVESEINKSLLRPLPKTDQGLADLSKTRPIALMEALLKLTERIVFSRVMGVIVDHKMLRPEQHGGHPDRAGRAPIRALTEVIEDAIVSGNELHVFSADISKAFDSLEYWSQAMGWKALGMPDDLVEMLVGMDEQGKTAVIMGQGRTTASIDNKEGWFKSRRGVRQGSVGGPIKWIVFMNFWLEYVHKTMEGEGYNMSQADPLDDATLAHMFVDDSNWITDRSEAMTTAIRLGEKFTNFHGLAFNKGKCEYFAVNQDSNQEGRYDRPRWTDGQPVEAKMRRSRNTEEELQAQASAEEEIQELRATILAEQEEIVTHPGEQTYDAVLEPLEAWTEHIRQRNKEGIARAGEWVMRAVTETKRTLYGEPEEGRWEQSTKEWMHAWREAIELEEEVGEGEGQATRYLGVWFELNLKWKRQREILENKFKGLKQDIGRSNPTREQAIYCVNAVINAAIKYPLQVAHIPASTLRTWDSRNRATIRKAGFLPTHIGAAMHLPKSAGGLGLMSMEKEIMEQRVTDQTWWLNSTTSAGAVVRAARKRYNMNKLSGKPEKRTLQHRTAEAMTSLRVATIAETDPFVDPWQRRHENRKYDGERTQAAADKAEAESKTRRRQAVRAFGDGSTYASEDRAGWGMVLNLEDDPIPLSLHWGRTAGEQTNDAAETSAILRAMLETHPMDDLTIYCDNQGCVDVWKTMDLGKETRLSQTNRALWIRIKHMRILRKAWGAKTAIEWVHSHVDDTARRSTTKAKYMCACRCKDECDPEHWAHIGNGVADGLAKKGAWCEALTNNEELRGEKPFALADEQGRGSAQGNHKQWLRKKMDLHAMTEEGESTRAKLATAKKRSHQGIFESILKQLDNPGQPTWRFWVRLTLECLPTHKQMAKFANATPDNIYRHVYTEAIGEQGKCVRCEAPEESVTHAVFSCKQNTNRWLRLEHQLDEKWSEQQMEWEQVNWLWGTNPKYPDWTTADTITGRVPPEISDHVNMNTPKIYKLVKESALMILKTSKEAWAERNEATLEWTKLQLEHDKRKKHANRTAWRWTKADTTPTDPPIESTHHSTRLKRTRKEAESQVRAAIDGWKDAIDKGTREYYESCRTAGKLPAPPGMVEEAEDRQVREWIRDTRKRTNAMVARAKVAVGTRDIKEEELVIMTMHHTQPATSDIKLANFWIPRVGTHVRVLWTGPDGEKHGNLHGHWFGGKVTSLTWPEDEGTPGVWIKYGDRSEHWHAIDMCGTTVEPLGTPQCGKGKPFSTMFPKETEQWMGVGTRIVVKWLGARWVKGSVVGRDRHGIIVQYPDGSAVAHDDLHTRGCRILEFRRDVNAAKRYDECPWLECPYKGEEEDCECRPCDRNKWPEWLRKTGMTQEEVTSTMSTDPWDRRAKAATMIQQRRGQSTSPNDTSNQTCPDCDSPVLIHGGSLSCTCSRCWCTNCDECDTPACECKCRNRHGDRIIWGLEPPQKRTERSTAKRCSAKPGEDSERELTAQQNQQKGKPGPNKKPGKPGVTPNNKQSNPDSSHKERNSGRAERTKGARELKLSAKDQQQSDLGPRGPAGSDGAGCNQTTAPTDKGSGCTAPRNKNKTSSLHGKKQKSPNGKSSNVTLGQEQESQGEKHRVLSTTEACEATNSDKTRPSTRSGNGLRTEPAPGANNTSPTSGEQAQLRDTCPTENACPKEKQLEAEDWTDPKRGRRRPAGAPRERQRPDTGTRTWSQNQELTPPTRIRDRQLEAEDGTDHKRGNRPPAGAPQEHQRPDTGTWTRPQHQEPTPPACMGDRQLEAEAWTDHRRGKRRPAGASRERQRPDTGTRTRSQNQGLTPPTHMGERQLEAEDWTSYKRGKRRPAGASQGPQQPDLTRKTRALTQRTGTVPPMGATQQHKGGDAGSDDERQWEGG